MLLPCFIAETRRDGFRLRRLKVSNFIPFYIPCQPLVISGPPMQPLSGRLERGSRLSWFALLCSLDRYFCNATILSNEHQKTHLHVVGPATLPTARDRCSSLLQSRLHIGWHRFFSEIETYTRFKLCPLDTFMLQTSFFHQFHNTLNRSMHKRSQWERQMQWTLEWSDRK